MPPRILIVGTGLIGASLGLALKSLRATHPTELLGWDANPAELATALSLGALDHALPTRDAVLAPGLADIYILATPVLPILDWMQHLAPALGPGQFVTDVGSTKLEIATLAAKLFNREGRARFLPGHPMAGKESGGAAQAATTLFQGATWLFTPQPLSSRPEREARSGETPLGNSPTALKGRDFSPAIPTPLESGFSRGGPTTTDLETLYRTLIAATGAHLHDISPERHDELCAWVSHLPQFLSTALAALLQDTFAHDPDGLAAVQAIGGRGLRETTRLGASPYSMWRDIAMTNTDPIAATLWALEQRLTHLRENLRTPELREEFATANRFRKL